MSEPETSLSSVGVVSQQREAPAPSVAGAGAREPFEAWGIDQFGERVWNDMKERGLTTMYLRAWQAALASAAPPPPSEILAVGRALPSYDAGGARSSSPPVPSFRVPERVYRALKAWSGAEPSQSELAQAVDEWENETLAQKRNPCCGNIGTHGEGGREYCSTCGQEQT